METSEMNSTAENLLYKLENKSAVIGVFGLGYVGQPLALRYSEVGYKVIGFDIDQEKVDSFNQGHSSIEHIDNGSVKAATERGLEATTNFTKARTVDAIILCVPTPLNRYREPDLSFVINTIDAVLPYVRNGQVVSLESTTYPGTTEEELLPRLESRGLKVGKDVYLVYSPEREDPGNEIYNTQNIPKIVGGHSKTCLAIGTALYEKIIDRIVPVSSTRAAEMAKLLENIHRAVNIGLVNEMKVVAEKMGIDIFEVIDAAATKPFGFTPYYPGPGLGGHCIPIDPFYLTWKAREFGLHTRFIELAGEINQSMPEYVFDKLLHALNTQKKAINGSKILFLGIAYKKNVDDMRESPAVEVMELVAGAGGVVAYSDPHVPIFPKMRQHDFELQSTDPNPETLADFDAVVLTTDHEKFDFPMIKEHAKMIIDSRGVFRENSPKIIRA